ncbi:hypothetical protein D3C84_1258580 [compost metagenome]
MFVQKLLLTFVKHLITGQNLYVMLMLVKSLMYLLDKEIGTMLVRTIGLMETVGRIFLGLEMTLNQRILM